MSSVPYEGGGRELMASSLGRIVDKPKPIPGFKEPPSGWYTFGTHAGWNTGEVPRLEFSEDVDEAGMPYWERPLLLNLKTMKWEPINYG